MRVSAYSHWMSELASPCCHAYSGRVGCQSQSCYSASMQGTLAAPGSCQSRRIRRSCPSNDWLGCLVSGSDDHFSTGPSLAGIIVLLIIKSTSLQNQTEIFLNLLTFCASGIFHIKTICMITARYLKLSHLCSILITHLSFKLERIIMISHFEKTIGEGKGKLKEGVRKV